MTDLTNDELREACEAAGLTVVDDAEGWFATVTHNSRGEPFERVYEDDDPALPAYVASLLVAKVRAMPETDDRVMQFCSALDGDTAVVGWALRSRLATDAQRIRAALAVLREAT